ncbi:hypothetical protein, variant [Aphanomyces invadans]|uniref:KATNIP domain-containing protein n=1 Tax=Aphanomyces invadans TaxID=157072 RepID=A0A024UGB3_9STRA|nr:hypothetical protein, variant [Aphanomyces invadans]ETW04688.1 hypothetical protein, variant [Aphanomyces invadans]|eukprot:XP_008866125.1 hypothetical protein, variant [Aphanomyces invadans]
MSDPHRKERKWSSKASAPPLTTIPSVSDQLKAGATMAENTPAMEKQLQYLRKLEERNRIKKKLDEQSKNDKDVLDKEKEVGFTTNFNGENAHRKNKHARPPDKTRAKSAGPMKVPSRTAPVAAPPSYFISVDERADSKRRSGSQSAGNLPLHAQDSRATSRPKQKWAKPQGVAEQRDGCIVFSQQPSSASKNEDNDAEPEDFDDEYLDESFEEFEDKQAGDLSLCKETKQDGINVEANTVARPCRDAVQPTPSIHMEAVVPAAPVAFVEESAPSTTAVNVPLGQTTAELNALIQGLSRDKQRELVKVLTTFTNSTKQASDVHALQQSIADPALWSQLTAPIAQLTSNQRAWEAEMARKLEFEREESVRLMAEAEARRADRLRKLEAEEREFEALMMQRRQDMQRKLMEASMPLAVPYPIPPLDVFVPSPAQTTSLAPSSQATEGPAQVTTVAAIAAARTTAATKCAIRDPPQQHMPPPNMATPRQTVSPPKPQQPSIPQVPLPSEVYMSMGLPPAAPSAPNPSKQSTTTLSNPKSWIEVRIKLLSSWGKTRLVGLTQICVYDMDGNEVDVPVESLRLFSGPSDGQPIPKSNSMVRDLCRLFNGMANTCNDKDMWLGRQIDAHPLQIVFGVPVVPSKLCVWNYNSKLHVGACAQDVEVFVDNQCKWTGSLPETYGSEDENVCVWISVASAMRKKAKDVPKPLANAPVQDNAPHPTTTTSGPIWLASPSASTTQLAQNSLKLDSSSLTSPATTAGPTNPNDAKSMKPLPLDLLSSDAPIMAGSTKNQTSRRRNVDTTSISTTDLSAASVAKSSTTAQLEMPSLQSSWDTLEHFKRTNRSRLEPAGTTTSRTSLGMHGTSNVTMQPTTFLSSSSSIQPDNDDVRARSSIKNCPSDLLRAPTLPTPSLAIPILPTGRKLVLECLSTWGDPYYIGLNGVDIFDDRGQPVVVSAPQEQVSAVPASINVLPEYASSNERDPRVATNLVDGVNYTCDDLHMWLAPFTPHDVHAVTVEFPAAITISMLRIWNYNKSRAHSFRGVRVVRVVLDSQVIFQGEIRQAPGILGPVDQCCEVILFTTDQSLLASIEQIDVDPTMDDTADVVHDIHTIPRPTTAEQRNNQRPKTSHTPIVAAPSATLDEAPQPSMVPVASAKETVLHTSRSTASPAQGYRGRVLKLIIQSTWGDRHYVGLTGISLRVLRPETNVIVSSPLASHQLQATPRDLESLGYVGDPRTLDKLVDGINVTCDDTHMWLVPFEGGKAELSVHLPTDSVLFGLDVWNYNKSAEDTFRGVKTALVVVDSILVATVAVRKAPGHALFDFKQTIVLDEWARYPGTRPSPSLPTYKTHLLKQDYEPPLLPTGFLLKFVFWSTWGDPYYIGLNGIELYDSRGDKLPPPTLVAAAPSGLADVDVQDDIRVVQNLFLGVNNTWDAANAWLAPLASSLGRSEGTSCGALQQALTWHFSVFHRKCRVCRVRHARDAVDGQGVQLQQNTGPRRAGD